MTRALPLARLRKTLRRQLAPGFVRAVFAYPQGADGAAEPEVVEGSGRPDEEALRALCDRAEAAARAGRVKQTFVLDAATRLRVDARHGTGKLQRIDADTVEKMMGGKDRTLRPDASADLLRHIGIMNPDGSISAKNAKKYKQINHFVELCRPVWTRLVAQGGSDRPLRVFDLGCGNSYLSFVLAEALRLEGIPLRLVGVDRRDDVIERSRARTEALGWEHLQFRAQSIGDLDLLELGGPPDLVVSLHACDTATDEALARAIQSGARAIFAAPCCQHELAEQLRDAPVSALVRHGLFKQDYAALLTDALRAELVEAQGYRVDLLEFVASEHSAKNRLIRAFRHDGRTATAWAAIVARCRELGVHPRLLALLDESRAAASH